MGRLQKADPLPHRRSIRARKATRPEMEPIQITVAGAAGRMGRSIVRCVLNDAECTLVGAIESAGHPSIGRDAAFGDGASGVAISADWTRALCDAEAVIDFTVPTVSVSLSEQAAKAAITHVIGTTGFNEQQKTRIAAAGRETVIVQSGNMSLGANLVAALVERAARVLRDFDVQIVEMHHRAKKDAPSGTALMLGHAAAKARVGALPNEPNGMENISFASLRGGTVVGEHKVIFAGPHERVILEHVAEDRSIFARGAVAAAKWGRGQAPGLYNMLDVLGL
jgi:4-hydroxy-tetrahydrodipicolinate reductase